MSEWISVKDRLPDYLPEVDYSANVICTNRREIFIMARCYDYDAEGWMWGNCYGDIYGDPEVDDDYSDITHWMPLPEAPKEQA
jgi:regulator of RNase E activity RraB